MQELIESLLLRFLVELKHDNEDISELIETCDYEDTIARVVEEALENIDSYLDHQFDDE